MNVRMARCYAPPRGIGTVPLHACHRHEIRPICAPNPRLRVVSQGDLCDQALLTNFKFLVLVVDFRVAVHIST